MQNLWRRLEKKDILDCANNADLDHILRDQFITALKADPVLRALQEKVRVQPTTSCHVAVVDAVVWDQEEAGATVAVTKQFAV